MLHICATATLALRCFAVLFVLASVAPCVGAVDKPRVLKEYTIDDASGAGVLLNNAFSQNLSRAKMAEEAAPGQINTRLTALNTAMDHLAAAVNNRALAFNSVNTAAAAVTMPAELTVLHVNFRVARSAYIQALAAGTLNNALYANLNSTAGALNILLFSGDAKRRVTNVITALSALGAANADVAAKTHANTTARNAVAMARTNITITNTRHRIARTDLTRYSATNWGRAHTNNSVVSAKDLTNRRLLAVAVSLNQRSFGYTAANVIDNAAATANNDVRDAYRAYHASLAAVYSGLNRTDLRNATVSTAKDAVTTARNTFLAAVNSYRTSKTTSGVFNSGASTVSSLYDANFNAAFAAANAGGANYDDFLRLANAIDDLRRVNATIAGEVNAAKNAVANLSSRALDLAAKVVRIMPEGNAATNAFVAAQLALAATLNAGSASDGKIYLNFMHNAATAMTTAAGFAGLDRTFTTSDLYAAVRAQRTVTTTAAATAQSIAAALDASTETASLEALRVQHDTVAIARAVQTQRFDTSQYGKNCRGGGSHSSQHRISRSLSGG